MVELRKLSPDDGNDIYELLQLIPKDENGLINKANGLSFEEYKQWLINKQIESEQKGLVDGWKVPSTTYWLYVDNVPVGFGSIREFLTDALRSRWKYRLWNSKTISGKRIWKRIIEAFT